MLVPLNPSATFDNYFEFYHWAIHEIICRVNTISLDTNDAFVKYEPEAMGVVDHIINRAMQLGFTTAQGYSPIAYMDDYLLRYVSGRVDHSMSIHDKSVVYLTFNEFLRYGDVGTVGSETLHVAIYFQDEIIVEDIPYDDLNRLMTDECRTFISLSKNGQIAFFDTNVIDRSMCVGSINVTSYIAAIEKYQLSICWEIDEVVIAQRIRRLAIRLMNKYELVYIPAEYVTKYYSIGAQCAGQKGFKLLSTQLIGLFVYYLLTTHVSVGVVALI